MLKKYHILVIFSIILAIFSYFYNEHRLNNIHLKRGDILYHVLNNKDINENKALLSKYIESDKNFILTSLYYIKSHNDIPYDKDDLLDKTLSYKSTAIKEIMLYYLHLHNIKFDKYKYQTINYSDKLLNIFMRIDNKEILDKNFLNDLDLDLNKPKQYELYAHKLSGASY
ncbi:MAG: hypothetical protein OEY79_03710 [Anaplasmataceae bacterium]|nr:hypothetical protein [Anaplasmataceae bacterium]